MVIVVTGSSGFIGRNLVDALRQAFPEAELRRLVRSPTGRASEYLVDYREPGSLMRSPALEGADYLFHVAGVTRGLSARSFRDGNVLPTRNLLEAIDRRDLRLRRFLLVSSQAAAGPSRSASHFRTEEETPAPVEAYGQSKLEAETITRSHGGRIPFTIIRPGVVFGPYDVEFLNIFRLTKLGLNLYPGYKHRYVSYILVLDLVRAIIDAARSDLTLGKAYFVCNDKPATWQEIHETVFSLAGKRAISFNLPYPLLFPVSCAAAGSAVLFRRPAPLLRPQGLRISRPDYWIASNGAALRDFGFAPSHDLAEGLRLTYAWYKRARLV